MGKLIKVILIVLGVTVAGAVVVVVAGGLGGAIWYQEIPKVDVTNQCTDPIAIPEQYRGVPAIPETIPTNGTVTVPVVSGTGEYHLYETDDGLYIGFPRSFPIIGDLVRIGGTGIEPDATFDGSPVTIPMERTLQDTVYQLILCP